MTRKKKSLSQKTASIRKSEGSFRKLIWKTRKEDSKNDQVDQSGNTDLLDSREDANDLYKAIIQEFSVIRKSDGLITGTNEVLRLLEKEKLIAVFILKDKASPSIKNNIFKICRDSGTCCIRLEEKDKHILSPEFPKSIMYGIKNEPLAALENLRKLLLKLPTKRKSNSNKKDDGASFIDVSSNETELSTTEKTINREVLNTSLFYHTHKDYISKKSNQYKSGFLSLNKFSSDEKETEFLDYDSVACSGVLSIK